MNRLIRPRPPRPAWRWAALIALLGLLLAGCGTGPSEDAGPPGGDPVPKPVASKDAKGSEDSDDAEARDPDGARSQAPAGDGDTDDADQEAPEADDGAAPHDEPEPAEALTTPGHVGAESAARYFVDLLYYAFVTGDVQAWDALAAPGCAFCESVSAMVTDLYAEGGRIEAGEPAAQDLGVWITPDGAFTVELQLQEPVSEVYDGSGALLERNEAAVALLFIDLDPPEHTGHGWLVTQVAFAE